MSEPTHIIVARLAGDVCTKGSQTRRTFQRRLKSNLKDALNRARADYSMQLTEARIDIAGDDPALVEYASRVFGLASITRGRQYDWQTLDDVVRLGVQEFGDAVVGKKFAVRTRRSGNTRDVPFRSPDVDRALGAALLDRSAGVNLDNPEFTARVDVRSDSVVFYEAEVPAPGGLPMGVEGRALALISGGFDSSVAAFEMMSRGIDLDFVFFNLGGPPHEQAVIDVLRTLTDRWCYGARPELHVVDFRPIVGELKTKVRGRYWQVLLKRLMLRAADRIASEGDYLALVTGDALGQVSSQTLHNLHAVSAPIQSLILRPLVGYDKDDIIKVSRIVGTHDLSAQTAEYCALDAGRPATRCSVFDLDRAESDMELGILDELIDARRIERCDKLEDPVQIEVRVMSIAEDAVVLDLRDEVPDDHWQYDGAVHFPYERALQSVQMLPKAPNYVLFCDVGLKSAFLAEQMCVMGFRASSFAGGLPALKRWCARRARPLTT